MEKSFVEGITLLQTIGFRPAYSKKGIISTTATSRRTAYRRLNRLESLGLVTSLRGSFVAKTEVAYQPLNVLQKLIPSLKALKRMKRFGKSYNVSDITFAMQNISNKFVTLDYKAWELTRFQYPSDYFIYVNDSDINATTSYLKDNGFFEGSKGHVVLLPLMGDFSNEIERVYFDCIAKGGRSTLDAIAIGLLYEDKIKTKGRFTIEDIKKVQEDMPLTTKTMMRASSPAATANKRK